MNYHCPTCKEIYPMKLLAQACLINHVRYYADENSLNYLPEYIGKNIMPLITPRGKGSA